MPILRSVAPVKRAALVPEQFALQQGLGQRGAVEADERSLLAWRRIMHGPRHQLLAHTRLAANQHRGATGRRPRDFTLHITHQGTAADQLALVPQTTPQLLDFGPGPRELFGEFHLPTEVGEGQRHVVGHGQRELQIVRVGLAIVVGGVQMDQPDDAIGTRPNRSADDAGGMDLALAVAGRQQAVARHVAGQHGLAFAQHRVGQEAGDAMVARLDVRPGGDHFQIAGRERSGLVPRGQQHGTCIDLGPFEQTLQRPVGDGRHVGLLRQFERQPTQHGRRVAHPRRGGILRPGFQVSRVHATMRDRGRLVRFVLQHRVGKSPEIGVAAARHWSGTPPVPAI